MTNPRCSAHRRCWRAEGARFRNRAAILPLVALVATCITLSIAFGSNEPAHAEAQLCEPVDNVGSEAVLDEPASTTPCRRVIVLELENASRRGPYLIFAPALVGLDGDFDGFEGVETGPGGWVTLGYRPGSKYSFEVSAILSFHEARELDADRDNDATLLGGSAGFRLWLPLTERTVEAFGVFGLGVYSFESDRVNGNEAEGPGWTVGVGIDYRLNRKVALGLMTTYTGILADETYEEAGERRFGDTLVDLFVGLATLSLEL